MPPVPATRRQIFLFVGGLIILLAAVYGQTLFHDFVYWDDPSLILDNPFIRGITPQNVVHAFSHYDPDLYVPVTFLSFQVNYMIGGLEPFIYHLTNLFLHAASAFLVGGILHRITGKKAVALFGALLFAVHPINVEAVAWASARKDLLSGFFFLFSLRSFLAWRSSGSRGWYAASLAAFLLGLLSKVSILGLPLLLLLTERHARRPLTKKFLLSTVPFFALSAVFAAVAIHGKGAAAASLAIKFLIGMQATLSSLWHLAWPFDYSVIYPFSGAASLMRWDLLVAAAIVLAISAAVTVKRKRFPSVFFAWWWFLILLAPSFLTVEKGEDLMRDLYLTSDRYVYLAAIGPFLLAGLLYAFACRRSPKGANAAAVPVIILLAVLAFLQCRTWANTETLFRHALARNPESAVAHNNLGVFYDAHGDSDAAFREYEEAARAGGTGDAWFNYGMALQKRNRTGDAIAALLKAVELRPTYAFAQLNLGALLLDAGEIQASVDHLLAAQKLDPRNIAIYLNLGMALEKGGDVVDAREAYTRALQLDPQNAFAKERLVKIQ